MPEPLRAVILSDFNVTPLTGCVAQEPSTPRMEAVAGPYGQVLAALEDERLECWQRPVDLLVVWTQPDAVIGAFRDACDGAAPDLARIEDEVDAFVGALASQRRAPLTCIVSWGLAPCHRAYGIHAMQHGAGLANLLLRMNLRLCERAAAHGLHVLDREPWLRAAGERAFNPRLWALAHVPFDHAVFRRAARDVKAAIRTLRGGTRKLLVLDLDNTLWGGVLGDLGWERLRLGGHDRDGESFVEFQRAVLALARRGVLLAVVSKNDEALALEAMTRHPEMVLRPAHLAGWRISWEDKARGIAELAEELRLGLGSIVFVDDHPIERARVRETLPEVLVPDWPARPELYVPALHALDCFDMVAISEEDRTRTEQYVAERERAAVRQATGSIDEWLRTLETRVHARPLTATDCGRASQLLNRSNQMNLITRRLSPAELTEWAASANREVWTFRVSDRFGAAGLTGLASLELRDGVAELVDFVLSCRVMGRRVEESMLHVLTDRAARAGAHEVVLRYRPTPKNAPCLGFLQRSALTPAENHEFRWRERRPYPAPAGIAVVTEGAS